jgi:hypothetical protein
MKYALVYGGIAGAIVIAAIVGGLALDLPNHLQSELFGYLIMLAALSLIFVGIKKHRDVECGGIIKFTQGLIVGLGISAVAAIVYIIGWEIFLATSGRDSWPIIRPASSKACARRVRPPPPSRPSSPRLRDMATMYRNRCTESRSPSSRSSRSG